MAAGEFGPYFTTKDHGIGLGLASAYSIVERPDGLQSKIPDLNDHAGVVHVPPYRAPIESFGLW